MEKVIEGYIIKYGQLSRPLMTANGRKVFEKIAAGAFAESVNAINAGQAECRVNIEHSQDALDIIGRVGKNVTIENRADGVYARVTVLKDSLSADLWERVSAGLVNGFSIEFQPLPGQEPSYTVDNGNYIRTFNRAILKGFAVTANPAYAQAECYARGINAVELAQIENEIKGIEQRKYYEAVAYILGVKL